jgi:hypothetical protein
MTDNMCNWCGVQPSQHDNGECDDCWNLPGHEGEGLWPHSEIDALKAENARLRETLLPFAAIYAAYQRDYNSDRDKAAFYATINNEANWFSIWMHHDGYKLAQEADYQQAAAMTEESTE